MEPSKAVVREQGVELEKIEEQTQQMAAVESTVVHEWPLERGFEELSKAGPGWRLVD